MDEYRLRRVFGLQEHLMGTGSLVVESTVNRIDTIEIVDLENRAKGPKRPSFDEPMIDLLKPIKMVYAAFTVDKRRKRYYGAFRGYVDDGFAESGKQIGLRCAAVFPDLPPGNYRIEGADSKITIFTRRVSHILIRPKPVSLQLPPPKKHNRTQ